MIPKQEREDIEISQLLAANIFYAKGKIRDCLRDQAGHIDYESLARRTSISVANLKVLTDTDTLHARSIHEFLTGKAIYKLARAAVGGGESEDESHESYYPLHFTLKELREFSIVWSHMEDLDKASPTSPRSR